MALFPSNITAAANAVPTPFVPLAPGLGNDDIVAASQALTTPSPIVPVGMVRPYLAHQGAAHVAAMDAIARWGTVLLGDDMGMGKTQVLFGIVAEHIAQGGYAIMIAPPVAKAGYMSDLAASFPHLRFAHLSGRKADMANLPIADIYWMTDDAPTMAAWLTRTETQQVRGKDEQVMVANAFALGSKILVRDEIHRDKGANGSASTGRAKVMTALGKALRNQGTPIIGATGTLLTNRVVESYVPLNYLGGAELVKALAPGVDTPKGFLYRYCQPQTIRVAGGRQVTVFNGADPATLTALHENLRRSIYVRREKSDLGNLLPHSGWIVKPIALNGVLRRYNDLERDFLNTVLAEEGPEAYWKKSRMEAAQQMMALWQEAGNAKVGATVDYVKDLTDQGRKVVVFYYHEKTWQNLAIALGDKGIDYASINSHVTGDRRIEAIDDFQNDNGKAQVMLAQIRAAGMAVTLTAAADAVFCQVPWSAGDLKQAADRILRTDARTMERATNGESITWHVLQAAQEDGSPTFDMAMWSILENKAHVCDSVNAGRPVTIDEDSLLQQALEAWYPTAKSRY